jgi:preprotein translocase subunit SecG
MGTIGVVLLVFFVIVCLLLVLLVSIQDDGENGMGLLGGRGTAAFGSHSGSVLTKTTFVLVFLFFALSLGLALVNKKPKIEKDLVPTTVEAADTTSESTTGNWWAESEAAE